MINDQHSCSLVSGEKWQPALLVGNQLQRLKIRGKVCVCGRFEASVRRPLPVRRDRFAIQVVPVSQFLLALSQEDNKAARELLQTLVKQAPRRSRWESILKRLIQSGFSSPQIEDLVERLCTAGIVRIVERNIGHVHDHWKISQIEIVPTAVEAIYQALGLVPQQWNRLQLLAAIEPAINLPINNGPRGEIACRVRDLLKAQADGLLSGGELILRDPKGEEVVRSSRWNFFAALVHALAGVAVLLADGKDVAAESFATRVYGKSKELTAPRRQALIRLLGTNLENVGLVERESEVRVFGPIQCSIDSYLADGRATGSWLGLPASSFQEAEFAIDSDRLLIIENLTPFEELARSCANSRRWPYIGLFGGGYISSVVTALITRAIDLGVKEVGVWADMDPDGILLAQDIIDLVCSLRATAKIFAMDRCLFRRATRLYSLDPMRVHLLVDHLPRLKQPLSDLATDIISSGTGVEQENVLQDGLEEVNRWRGAASPDIVAYAIHQRI